MAESLECELVCVRVWNVGIMELRGGCTGLENLYILTGIVVMIDGSD